MKFYIKFLFILLLPVGCNRNNIVYPETIEVTETVRLGRQVMNEDFIFSFPTDMFIEDSLIIVHDSYAQEQCFHIFNKNTGRHIGDFGRKGRGPGEMLNVSSVYLQNENVVAFDANLKKIVIYDIVNVLSGKADAYKELSLPVTENFIISAIPMDKNSFILVGNNDKMRFGVWNHKTSSISKVNSLFPEQVSDKEIDWAIANYASSFLYIPSKTILVSATYIGGVMEIFDVSEEKINRSHIRYFYEPVYGTAVGAVPKWIATKDDTTIGFQKLCATGDGIYALVWGTECRDMGHEHPFIVQFDDAGNAQKRFDTDFILETLAVDSNGDMYGITVGRSEDYKLCKFFGLYE